MQGARTVTGEACWNPCNGRMAARRDSSSQSKFQQVADESVVVSKFRPVKASNGVEGKTGMTWVNEYSGLQ